MTEPAQKLFLIIGAWLLACHIPYDEPQLLIYVRLGYLGAQLFSYLTYYHVATVIELKNDLTMFNYVQHAMPNEYRDVELVTATVRGYDLGQVFRERNKLLSTLLILAFLDLYMHYRKILVIATFVGLKELYDSKIVKIHVRGMKPVGDIQRPFTVPSIVRGPRIHPRLVAEAARGLGDRRAGMFFS